MNAEKMREKEVYLKFEESQPNKTKRNKTKKKKNGKSDFFEKYIYGTLSNSIRSADKRLI